MRFKLKKSLFWIKLCNWEFWPMNITYIPVMFYYLFLAIKSRSFGFFAAVNPSIPYGGMRGEPKYNILKKLPHKYYPTTIFIPIGTSKNDVIHLIKKNNFNYPIIGKPDIGERGYCVKKINSEQQLIDYHAAMYELDYLLQPYIPFEEEYAILHYRFPNEEKGGIISVCKKGFLKVTGDGKKTVEDLILDYPRAVLQYKRLQKILGNKLKEIPHNNEIYPLGLIGNHSLGTEFINANHEIDEDLIAVFDEVEQSLEGVYLARYDLRCKSMEEMKKGEHIYIVEVNGVGAEAAHIYDTRMSFRDRYAAMFKVWTIMYKIAKINNNVGHKNMSLKDIKNWQKAMNEHYPKIDRVKFNF
ncbi:MAG: hypothetical protein ACI94Y_000069 [Maribacter sp.]|jgi:hypothetical protein